MRHFQVLAQFSSQTRVARAVLTDAEAVDEYRGLPACTFVALLI